MGKSHCPLEGASSGTVLMILLKISQHLTKRGSKTGVVINAPAKYAANYFYCIKFSFDSSCELVC